MFEQAIQTLSDLFGPWARIILAFIALLAFLFPTIIRVWEWWTDMRSGKKTTAKERTDLELLKLRYEIEAIKTQNKLRPFPDDFIENYSKAYSSEADQFARKAITQDFSKAANKKYPWRWLQFLYRKNPSVATIVFWIIIIPLFFLSILFGFGTFGLFLVELESESPNVTMLIVFTVIAFGLFALTWRFLRQRTRLRDLSRVPQLKTAIINSNRQDN